MTTIGDVLTKLSDTGRQEVESTLNYLGVDHNTHVFAAQPGKDKRFTIRSTDIEEVRVLDEGMFEKVSPEEEDGDSLEVLTMTI